MYVEINAKLSHKGMNKTKLFEFFLRYSAWWRCKIAHSRIAHSRIAHSKIAHSKIAHSR